MSSMYSPLFKVSSSFPRLKVSLMSTMKGITLKNLNSNYKEKTFPFLCF